MFVLPSWAAPVFLAGLVLVVIVTAFVVHLRRPEVWDVCGEIVDLDREDHGQWGSL